MKILGGCLCGTTRYTLTTEPFGLGNCHCIDCQRSSGAAFVTWGSVPATSFNLKSGELKKVPYAGRVRSFAGCCGTPLIFEDKPGAEILDVAILSLDNPRAFPPQKDIWTEDKLPWVQLDPHLPSWPRSSLKKQ